MYWRICKKGLEYNFDIEYTVISEFNNYLYLNCCLYVKAHKPPYENYPWELIGDGNKIIPKLDKALTIQKLIRSQMVGLDAFLENDDYRPQYLVKEITTATKNTLKNNLITMAKDRDHGSQECDFVSETVFLLGLDGIYLEKSSLVEIPNALEVPSYYADELNRSFPYQFITIHNYLHAKSMVLLWRERGYRFIKINLGDNIEYLLDPEDNTDAINLADEIASITLFRIIKDYYGQNSPTKKFDH